jgi:hypothetical protein
LITDGHAKQVDIMAAMYQASYVGFDEDEATHVQSFKFIIHSLWEPDKMGIKMTQSFLYQLLRMLLIYNFLKIMNVV